MITDQRRAADSFFSEIDVGTERQGCKFTMNKVRPTLKGGYRGGKRRCKAKLRRVQPRGEEATIKRKEREKEGISTAGRESGRGLFFAKQQPASQLTGFPPPSIFFLHSLCLHCLAHKHWTWCSGAATPQLRRSTCLCNKIMQNWVCVLLHASPPTMQSNPTHPQHRHTLISS